MKQQLASDSAMTAQEAKDEVIAVFNFLDDLRASGQTNMFGAPPYLQSEFGFDKDTAMRYFVAWTKNFEDASLDPRN